MKFLAGIPFLSLLIVPLGYVSIPGIPFLGIYISLRIIMYIDPFKKLERDTLKISDIARLQGSSIDNIEHILGKSKYIYKYLQLLRGFQKMKYFFNNSSQLRLRELENFVINTIYSILTDLRSDLSIRLAEQQKILESAKGEVSENIKGTTELAQVSELQKARLDKQIEQFEELQRVLVKV